MDTIKGLNWADQRDNYQAGVIYPSGLTAADTHTTAAAIADKLVGRLFMLTGADTVRMPINEPTVSSYWHTYSGAVDAALRKGRVILCYWAAKDGKPADEPNFIEMWNKVTDEYAGNHNAFFEPINEPYGLDRAELNDFYADWLGRFPNIARHRLILDGSRYAQEPVTVGRDPRLGDCLLGYHEYSFFDKFPTETEWQDHMRLDVGEYFERTVCTEFGAVMNPGQLGERHFDGLLDYGRASDEAFVTYVRALTAQFRKWGIGSVYWPGVRDGDIYALCARSGAGRDTELSVANPSGLARVRHGWGFPDG